MSEPEVKDRESCKEAERQPVVGVPVECYSRIVGYLRPVQNWHQGKRQEFKERKTFQVPAEVVEEE